MTSTVPLPPPPIGALAVGANYHPHDSDRGTWIRDLDLMAEAGFRVLRAGHLAWDSYEPRDGEFDFAWFDEFLDLARERGNAVILDIAARPAPAWLHRKHPSIDIVNVHGKREHANHRYMEDVGDPAYVTHAVRFAEAMTAHFAPHPAVVAFGIDNEPGSGPYSYSESVRARFITWLQHRYTTVETLDRAWGGQRWSRRLSDFDEIDLPRSGFHEGPLERLIDFRTFVSDEIVASHTALIDAVQRHARGKILTGNQWYFVEGDDGRYFDYAPIAASGRITRGGGGLYPHNSQADKRTLYHALSVIARVQFESTTPYWATESTTETAVTGAVRKAAYASLLLGNQLMCAWTWQSHHAGEERFLQGLVDWDGQPNGKYEEYRRIAEEFRAIEAFGFPYIPRADVALGFSFASQLSSAALPELHDRQLDAAFNTVLELNVDARIVDIATSALDTRVLVLPGMATIDARTAERVRAFVEAGGTAVMTSGSGWFDANGKILSSTRPGLLDDVFGIRLGSYRETHILNEATEGARSGTELRIDLCGRTIATTATRFDDVHLRGADVAATIVGLDREYPAVTVNRFGSGRAVYLALPAREELLDAVLARELDLQGIAPALAVPRGVIARRTDDRHALLVNLAPEPRDIVLPSPGTSVFSGRALGDEFTLSPHDAEFITLS
ncbi:beta-galactosidase [Microbacterium sp. NPDC055683]